jgi:hypothetical protein
MKGSSQPLGSSGKSSWPQIQRSWVRFPALPDFVRSSGSGTGSIQPREDNWGATLRKWWIRSRKPRLTVVGIRCADLYLLKLEITSPTSGGSSVGIIRLRTKTTEFFFFVVMRRLFRLLATIEIIDVLCLESDWKIVQLLWEILYLIL